MKNLSRNEMREILGGTMITDHKFCEGCVDGNSCAQASGKPYDYCSSFTCKRPDGTLYTGRSCVYS